MDPSRKTLRGLFAFVLAAALASCAGGGGGPAGEPQERENEKAEPAKAGEPSEPSGPSESAGPAEPAEPPAGEEEDAPLMLEPPSDTPYIPPLPEANLPRRTREPPDPEKDRYLRESVHIAFSERVEPQEGEPYTPEVPVVENYLAEYFRRAGHPIAAAPGEARYAIEGEMAAKFHDTLVFRGRIIGWKYTASASLRVLDGEGTVLEEVEVPEISRTSIDEKTCVLDLRRYLAKKLHDRLFKEGKVFTDKEVTRLLGALIVDPLIAADPLDGKEIIERLADIGLPAVPYLIDALTDERTVLVEYDYPGLVNLDELKVYHVADKALEEIFQKVSRMNAGTTDEERYVIIRGWENEWRRFVKPFRESPHRPRRKVR